MSMSVTPAEPILYVELMAGLYDHHGRDPSEREGKALHSVARMMSADSTRTIQGISDELAASKMLIQELHELLRDARGLRTEYSGLLAARQAREESIGLAPCRSIDHPWGACQKICGPWGVDRSGPSNVTGAVF